MRHTIAGIAGAGLLAVLLATAAPAQDSSASIPDASCSSNDHIPTWSGDRASVSAGGHPLKSTSAMAGWTQRGAVLAAA